MSGEKRGPGRPRLMKESLYVGIRMDKALKDRLIRKALAQKKSLSRLMSEAAEAILRQGL